MLSSVIKLLLVILFLRVGFTANAASWYVDNAATGANNGTNWANAWLDPTNVVWGVSGVTAGDTLYISGGSTSKTYTNVFTVGAAGTATNRITIRVGQDSGHNGVVIFDGQQFGKSCTNVGVITINRNYVTIDGEVNGQKNMRFLNWRNFTNKNFCNVIYGGSSFGNVFKYLTISNANTCIFQVWPTNHTVAWCDLTAYGDTVIAFNNSRGPTNSPWDSNLIFSNTLRHAFVWTVAGDGRNAPDGVQCGDSISIFNNRFEMLYTESETNAANHNDYLQTGDGGWIKFYNNELIDTQDSQCSPAHFNSPSGLHDIWIYNNVFRFTTNQPIYDTFPQCIRMYNQAGLFGYTNVHIINNLFIDRTNATQAVSIGEEIGDSPGTNNILANNIFVNVGMVTGVTWELFKSDGAGQSQWTITNNILYHTDPASVRVGYLGTNYTAAQWKATFDPSTGTNLPAFVSYIPYAEANDFNLLPSDTAAIGKGLTFNDIFTTDYNGNVRGASWDIGPFESSGVAATSSSSITGKFLGNGNVIIR